MWKKIKLLAFILMYSVSFAIGLGSVDYSDVVNVDKVSDFVGQFGKNNGNDDFDISNFLNEKVTYYSYYNVLPEIVIGGQKSRKAKFENSEIFASQSRNFEKICPEKLPIAKIWVESPNFNRKMLNYSL
jgi:hypothetical protein